MTMFSGDLFSEAPVDDKWGSLKDFYQSDKTPKADFNLDSSELNQVENPYTAPLSQTPPEFKPADLTEQQYGSLYNLMGSYGVAEDKMQDIANLFAGSSRVSELEELINKYNFDEDRYRAGQQSAIQQGVGDLTKATIGSLVANGQLNSSIGKNYMEGAQAKYLTQSLAGLEDRIQQFKSQEASREQGWTKDLNEVERQQKRDYADFTSKALGLGIEADQKMFDGLGEVMRGEISWDTFMANYGKMDQGDGWAPSGSDFNQIGTDLSSFITSDGYQWDVKTPLPNGYSTMKEAVGPDNYRITYYDADGALVADYTFAKTANFTDVARALWAQFDASMKADWESAYGVASDPVEDDPVVDDPIVGEWQPDSGQLATIGGDIQSFITDTTKYPFDGTPVTLNNGYTTTKEDLTGGIYRVKYYDPNGGLVASYMFNSNETYASIAQHLWAQFDDGMKADWEAVYSSGASTPTEPPPVEPTPVEPSPIEPPPVEPDPVATVTWVPTSANFSSIGDDLESYIKDLNTYPINKSTMLPNGYTISKSYTSNGLYVITYYAPSGKVAEEAFRPDSNYASVAQKLWDQFDNGMKADWESTYGA